MAAPRKYSDEQRAAIFARAELGVTPAEIARECAAGLASCAPFQIPRRTAQQIVADMRRERGPGQPRSLADLESAEAIRGYPLRVLRIVGEDLDRIEGRASLTDGDLERMKKGLAVAREARKFLRDTPPARSAHARAGTRRRG